MFRTTWDYFNRFDHFMQWLDETAKQITFINPLDLIRWNLDKHYLADLKSKHINIPETVFIEPGETLTLKELCIQTGWTSFILKPAVSGAACTPLPRRMIGIPPRPSVTIGRFRHI